MTAPAAPDLDSRYGRTRGRRIRGRLLAVLVAAAILVTAVLWVVWIGLFSPAGQVDERDLGYTTTADTVTVRSEVTAPAGRRVGCAVQALSESHVTVGWKVVRLPASADRTRQISTVVRTSQPAVTGLIYRCWLT